MRKLLIILVLSLPLGSCASVQKFTQTYVNPITGVTMYEVKNVYAVGLQLAIEYRNYCWGRPYAVLITDPIAAPICRNRRSIARSIQSAEAIASNSVRAADNFVRSNPSISAISLISAAWTAVNNFKNVVPEVPLP